MRIAAIHALRLSVEPTRDAFARLWPEATLANLLDDSLSADLAARGRLDEAMTGRFLVLARYAAEQGADGILFTCSAFGPCIAACAEALAPMPVLTPNEAMIAELATLAPNPRVGLIATFPPTLASMLPEFARDAPEATILPGLAVGALAALEAGDGPAHDRAAVAAATGLGPCDAIALAQFSLARAAPSIRAATGRVVLTTPDSAVRALRRRVAG